MLFYLTTLNLKNLLDSESDPIIVVVVDTWNYSNFTCKNYILNGFDNILYDVYSSIKSIKTLCKALDWKYKARDVGIKKIHSW
jgi:hypothetical protein